MGGCTKGAGCPDSHGTMLPFDFESAAAFRAAAGDLDSSPAASSAPEIDWQALSSSGPAFDLSSVASSPAAESDWSSAGLLATDYSATAGFGDGSSAASMLAAMQAAMHAAAGSDAGSSLALAPAGKIKPVGRQDVNSWAGAASQDDSGWNADSSSWAGGGGGMSPLEVMAAAMAAAGGKSSPKGGGWASALAAAGAPAWGAEPKGAPSWGKGSSKGGKDSKGKKGGKDGKGKKGGDKGDGKDGKKGPPMRKDGDWLCTSCKNVNFAWRESCNFCGADKPEEAREAKRQAEGKSKALPPGKNRATRDWACPSCEKPNFAWRTECFSCNTERPPMQEVDPNTPNDKAVGFKFTLCRFHLVNKCERGSLCTYAHTREELADAKATVKTSLCKYFAVGQCGRGALCTFAHGNEDLVHRHGKEQDTAKEAWFNAHLQLAIGGLKDLPAEQTAHLRQPAAPSFSSLHLELPPMPEMPEMDHAQILAGMELQQNASQALAFAPFPSFDFSAFAEGY